MMVDVGTELDAERAAVRDRLSARAPQEWDQSDIAFVKAPRISETSDSLRPFGSDFVFRDSAQIAVRLGAPEFALRPSFARGGLSNGWGAAILPYRDQDILDWPISIAELAPHYSAIREFVPVAARTDDLAPMFPALPIEADTSLPASAQAERVLTNLAKHSEALAKAGVTFGKARQAVAENCRLCAMCLHGCPYSLIFNAGDVIDILRQNERFIYKPGFAVERFAESADGIVVQVREIGTNMTTELAAERLFVGAGVLGSTHLVLHSLKRYETPVSLKDSQYFLLPMLQTWRAESDPVTAALHTLTQVFIEIDDPDIDPHTIHTQLYTYNDLLAVDMGLRLGHLAKALSPLVEQVSRRLMVAQCFLHSASSPRVEIRLARAGGRSALCFETQDHPLSSAIRSRTLRRLATVAVRAGLVPLMPLRRLGDTGSSYHCGGTFPMRKTPLDLETDIVGRPAGLNRVHLVDASTFPSIPATTITFTVMANAHRIASEA